MHRRHLLRLAAAALVVLAAGASIAATAKKPAFPAGKAEDGKKLFSTKGCIACHQKDGSGGLKLTGNPTPNWRDTTRMAKAEFDDAYLRDCIVNGKPKSGMVPWKRQLNAQQVEDMIAYIHTFAADERAKVAEKAAKKKTAKK